MAKLKKWGQKVTVSDRLNLDKDADENNTKIGDIIGDDTEQKKGDPRLLHQLTDGTKFLSISFDWYHDVSFTILPLWQFTLWDMWVMQSKESDESDFQNWAPIYNPPNLLKKSNLGKLLELISFDITAAEHS